MSLRIFSAIVSFLAISVSLASASTFVESAPKKVGVSFRKIYVPEGFDDNDNVQFVGEGVFSSGCYRYAETVVTVDQVAKVVRIAPAAYKYDGMCMMVILPFETPVDVGILKAGTYKVVQSIDNKELGRIHVRASISQAPDDFIYAPVSQAFFQSKNSENKIYITGSFPLSCMKLKEVRTGVQSRALVIQPIAELDNSVPCVEGKYDFETVSEIGYVKSGRYLLHVRSMNGKAVNNLVDIR